LWKINLISSQETGRLKRACFFFLKAFPTALFVSVAMKKDTKKAIYFCCIASNNQYFSMKLTGIKQRFIGIREYYTFHKTPKNNHKIFGMEFNTMINII